MNQAPGSLEGGGWYGRLWLMALVGGEGSAVRADMLVFSTFSMISIGFHLSRTMH